MEIFGTMLVILGMVGLMASKTDDWFSLACSGGTAMSGLILLFWHVWNTSGPA